MYSQKQPLYAKVIGYPVGVCSGAVFGGLMMGLLGFLIAIPISLVAGSFTTYDVYSLVVRILVWTGIAIGAMIGPFATAQAISDACSSHTDNHPMYSDEELAYGAPEKWTTS